MYAPGCPNQHLYWSMKRPVNKTDEEDLVLKFGEEAWKGQNLYKKRIMDSETWNQKHRTEMFQLSEAVNRIIMESGVKSNMLPDMYSQLSVVAKELENAEKLIQIYRKQLKTIEKYQSSSQQLQLIAQSNVELKERQLQLEIVQREVKTLSMKNKGVENRLNEYSKRGRQKSVDSHSLMMKDAVSENKVLKRRLQEIENSERRKEQWIKNNQQDTRDLERRVSVLPSIHSSRTPLVGSREKSSSSLSKLQNDKRIYKMWFKNYIPKNLENIQKEIEDFEKISRLLAMKISTLSQEIEEYQKDMRNYKQKVTPAALQKARNTLRKQEQFRKNLKNSQCNCDLRFRQSRRDWTGRFDGLRFSDSRYVREETRLFRIVHTNVGYYQFSYYLVKNPEKTVTCPLPFDTHSVLKGKQTSFTVEYPDYIKSFKLRTNPRTSKIFGMEVISNLGITTDFVDALEPVRKQRDKADDDEDLKNQSTYVMKVKVNEAPTLVFGSYSALYDQKKNLVGVHLQGLGVEIIQDYVQEAM